MPSFANVVSASQSTRLSESSTSKQPDTSYDAHPSSKQRMIHWSAIKGPLTEGFRKQREKEASKAIVPIAAGLPHSSQTRHRPSEMDSVLPTHFEIVEPLANTAFYEGEEHDHQLGISLHGYNPTTFQSIDAATYRSRVLGDLAHDVAPSGYQTFDWSPYTANDQMELHALGPPQDYALDNRHFSRSFDPRKPDLYSGLATVPSISTLTPVEWPTFEPVEPLYHEHHKEGAEYAVKSSPAPRKRKRAHQEDHSPPGSPPAKPRTRRKSLSNADRILKRKRSGAKAVRKQKSTSFHEQYMESAKTGDRLPTDLDCWGYVGDEEDDETRRWSTVDYLKKLGNGQSGKAGTNEEAQSEDLPSVYSTFQPIFKPKVDKNRMIITTNTFKLPILALNKVSQNTDKREKMTAIASGTFVPKRRLLFQPWPVEPKGASTVIEIFDDEEKKKQKADVLKGLSSSALGLVERPKGKSPVDGGKPAEPTEYKSALYRSTKLGNDMETTSSVPFAALEQVHHDDEDWTLSPEGTPMPEIATDATSSKIPEPAKPVASAGSNALQDPLAKRWTFKLFGRG